MELLFLKVMLMTSILRTESVFVVTPVNNKDFIQVDQCKNITMKWEVSSVSSNTSGCLIFSVGTVTVMTWNFRRLQWFTEEEYKGRVWGDKLGISVFALTLSNVRMADEGSYECRYNGSGVESKSGRINLDVKEDRKSPPVVSGVQDGEGRELTCHPRRRYHPDDPRLPVNVTWYRNGNPIEVNTSGLVIRPNSTHGTLNIGPLTIENNRDQYQCTIQEHDCEVVSNISKPFFINISYFDFETDGIISTQSNLPQYHYKVFLAISLTPAIVGLVMFSAITSAVLLWRRKKQREGARTQFLRSGVCASTNTTDTLHLQSIGTRPTGPYNSLRIGTGFYDYVDMDDDDEEWDGMPIPPKECQNASGTKTDTVRYQDVVESPKGARRNVWSGNGVAGENRNVPQRETPQKVPRSGFPQMAPPVVKPKQQIMRECTNSRSHNSRKVEMSSVNIMCSMDDLYEHVSAMPQSPIHGNSITGRRISSVKRNTKRHYSYSSVVDVGVDDIGVEFYTEIGNRDTYIDHELVENDTYCPKKDPYAKVVKAKRPRRDGPRRPVPAF